MKRNRKLSPKITLADISPVLFMVAGLILILIGLGQVMTMPVGVEGYGGTTNEVRAKSR